MPTPSLDWTVELTKTAGALTLQYFRQSFQSSQKGGHKGTVTEADLASEKLIKSQILGEFPQHIILAEESGWSVPAKEGVLWMVDPLDGTNNFSKGNPYYCVSVAWGYFKNGRVEVQQGVVVHPPTGDVFRAERSKGAYWNDKKLQMNLGQDLQIGAYFTGIGSAEGEELQKVTDRIFRVQEACESTSVRINGAAALDLSYVACGIAQGFWESKLNPWDTAAGSLLVEEAGGAIQNFKGESYDALRDPDLLAAPKDLINPLRKFL